MTRPVRDVAALASAMISSSVGISNLPSNSLERSGRGWMARAADLRQHMDAAIEAAGGQIIARGADRIATIAGYRMPGKAASAQLIQFDMAGIAVSAGSACSSGTLKTSKVLTAMGLDEDAANEVIRVSFGPETGRADVYRFLETWQRIRG